MEKFIDIKHFLSLSFGFVLLIVIGTISHEYGHIFVAKSLGYETTLHYGSMNYKNSDLNKKQIKIYNENKIAIDNKTDFLEEKEYKKVIKEQQFEGLLITIGGPLQTIITGIIGLLILLFRRNKNSKYELKLIDWLAIFLALFWSREVFNVMTSIGIEIISPNGNYFGGDEEEISSTLNLWSGTFSTVLGIIGLAVCVYIVFKIVPKKLRLTFILSGLIGGVFGFILWMNILGPIILP